MIDGALKRGLATLAGVVAIAVAVLFWAQDYLAEERVFYFWDSRFYHDLALAAWQAYRQSWTAWWAHLQASMAGDYNALFSVPLMPLFQSFGDSRTVYILGLLAWYLLPAALCVGWLAARLSPDRWLLVGWLAGLAMLAQPSLWFLTMVGLPGAGAVLLLGLAAAACLADPGLRRWSTPLWVGLFTALAILFRRHYGYAGVALYLAMGMVALAVRLGESVCPPRRILLDLCGRLGLAVLVLLGVMLALAPGFTREALTTDYGALYAGYQFQPLAVLGRWREAHGDLLLGLGALGIGMALWQGRLRPAAGALLGLWVLLWGLQWALLVRQIGVPHVVHVLPLVSSLGLGMGAVAAWQRRWSRPLAVAMVAVPALALGFLFGTSALESRGTLFGQVPRPAQLHAADYQQYLALGNYLQAELGGQAGYVAASSEFLNESLLESVLGRVVTAAPAPRILPTAHLDSRDWVPLAQLLEARWVLVATPPTLHLAPTAQTLITTTVDLFEGNRALARDFRVLSPDFEFADFTARIYRRERPTLAPRALRTLRFYQRHLPAPPGIQGEWVALDNDIRVQGLVGERGALQLVLDPDTPRSWPLALSWAPARGRALHAAVRIDDCATGFLVVSSLGSGGQRQVLAELALTTGTHTVALAPAVEDAHILLGLRLSAAPPGVCLLRVDDLRLEDT